MLEWLRTELVEKSIEEEHILKEWIPPFRILFQSEFVSFNNSGVWNLGVQLPSGSEGKYIWPKLQTLEQAFTVYSIKSLQHSLTMYK